MHAHTFEPTRILPWSTPRGTRLAYIKIYVDATNILKFEHDLKTNKSVKDYTNAVISIH